MDTLTHKPVQKTLTIVQTAALGGAIKDAVLRDAKANVPVGSHAGSMTVKIDYSIEKLPDSSQRVTANLLALPVLAKALRMSGFQRNNFYTILQEVALEALTAGDKVMDKMSEEDKLVLAEIEEIQIKVVSQLPKKTYRGQCKVTAQVTLLETSESLMP